MATGDQADQVQRLKSVLPPWFGATFPLLGALLQGVAAVHAFLYSLIAFAALQTRIRTATGGWLDLIATDFFGLTLSRAPGQADAAFLNLIIINLFRERATRPAADRVLYDLTNRHSEIFEPGRPQDTGGYGMPCTGYGLAGRYGSALLPFQAFITAYRPLAGTPAAASVTYAQIYAAVESVRPVGSMMCVRIADNYTDPFAPDRSLGLNSGTIRFGTSDQWITLPGWAS